MGPALNLAGHLVHFSFNSCVFRRKKDMAKILNYFDVYKKSLEHKKHKVGSYCSVELKPR
jgi:hypothetical protein